MDNSSDKRYITWINRNLIRAKKSYQIISLQDENIRNGKSLVDILEFLSQTKVKGLVKPSSKRATVFNIQVLLNRIAELQIRMSLISATDIEKGDSKSVMRLILGLICHFNPHLIRSKKESQFSPFYEESNRELRSISRTPPPTYESNSNNNKISKVSSSNIRSPIHMRIRRIMNSQRSNSEQSNIIISEGRTRRLNDVFFDQDLPRDIHEIHDQLTSLMQLLSRSDLESCQHQKREVGCQTTNNVANLEQLLQQKDSIITEQEVKLKGLLLELDKKDRTIDRYTRDFAAVKTQQTCIRLDSRHAIQYVAFLREVKRKESLDSADLRKLDDVISHLTSISMPYKLQMDKSNVAVINPCSNVKSELSLFSTVSLSSLSSNSDIQPRQQSSNPFLSPTENTKVQSEVKLICFLDNSVTPYISSIPLPSSTITLSHVKYYTKSVVPNNEHCKYIFKSLNSDRGLVQVEVSGDSDSVPVHDNKIMVRIRM